ncbi:hypothetical protein [Methylocystis bryophila]|uniref:Uncharacterized protein n=1 Tax=Methylocystis bryophila TaxID=655015 RepID=A0A1W6MYI9_9HYPH|nr:hypothetical protein [Methylocystis bryophila]ARN82651.1 hypothetical protein B1812_17860 [Methylocystis bryophila]BDV38864.1 hypothetical protein DSM21852_21170 [Methylocystis bryophila]
MKTFLHVLLIIVGGSLILLPGACAILFLAGGGLEPGTVGIVMAFSLPPILAGIFLLRGAWRSKESGQEKG